MGGAFRASGTGVPPIVNPAQSVRREWEGMGGGREAKQRKPKSDGGGFRLLGLGGLGCGGFQPHHITVYDHCV